MGNCCAWVCDGLMMVVVPLMMVVVVLVVLLMMIIIIIIIIIIVMIMMMTMMILLCVTSLQSYLNERSNMNALLRSKTVRKLCCRKGVNGFDL